jgi:hypothetical protein
VQARLDAVIWAVHHPRHHPAAPLSVPPSGIMDSLVGRAVELLLPAKREWHKALVQAYAERTGRHLLLFPGGDMMWLPLARGFYAWNVSGRERGGGRAPDDRASCA